MKLLVHRRGIHLGTNIMLLSKDDKNHSVCAALGCSKLANIAISLKISVKQLQYWFAKAVNINLKRAETVLEQICVIINYLKFEWTTGYIIEKIDYILISVLQNDGIAYNT